MATQWKPGDVVRLKSSGPAMTVKGPAGPGSRSESRPTVPYNVGDTAVAPETPAPGDVRCQWFDGAALLDGVFSPDSLEATEPAAQARRKSSGKK